MSEQVKITLRDRGGKGQQELLHDTGNTLLETMREGAVLLPSLCDGMGKCGKCMVRFCGYAPLPTQADRSRIGPERLREGYRLACTARPKRECEVEADFAAAKTEEESRIHVLTDYYSQGKAGKAGRTALAEGEALFDGGAEAGRKAQPAEGGTGEGGAAGGTLVAADIGTTTIAMQLVEIGTGRILEVYTCLNPQRSYGMDVISRINAANGGEGKRLQDLVRDALAAGLGRLKQYAGLHGAGEPGLVCIACNAAMGHIFMGYPTETLGKSPFRPVDIKTGSLRWEGRDVALLPGISAFVGGDIVAGLYACGLCRLCAGGKGEADGEEEDCGWLFMDLGTNAEMVMGIGSRVAATAAAAGPAFEGRGKGGGAGAERLHALAELLERGVIDSTGLLEEPYFRNGIEAGAGDGIRRVMVTQEDIRDIQMAKAAVRAGIHFLAQRLGIEDYRKIKKTYIAGGMGFYLGTREAVRIGLLPENLAETVVTVGNAALAGAACFGRAGWKEAGKALEHFAEGVEVFNMAELESFEEIYVGYMGFD